MAKPGNAAIARPHLDPKGCLSLGASRRCRSLMQITAPRDRRLALHPKDRQRRLASQAESALDAVSLVMAPGNLRWIGFSHFEPDECGALNQWLGVAPLAHTVCSTVGAVVMLGDFADRPPRPLADGEILQTGKHRLRFLATPHVPHCWDAGLFFDEGTQTLFCSDLFFHPGDPEPVIDSGIVERARESIEQNRYGPLARDMPYTPYTNSTLQRLAALNPKILATMHGSSFEGDGGSAIRELAGIVDELLGKPDAT